MIKRVFVIRDQETGEYFCSRGKWSTSILNSQRFDKFAAAHMTRDDEIRETGMHKMARVEFVEVPR